MVYGFSNAVAFWKPPWPPFALLILLLPGAFNGILFGERMTPARLAGFI